MRLLIRYAAFTVYTLCLFSLIGAAGVSVNTGFCYLLLTTASVAIYAGTSYNEGENTGYAQGVAAGVQLKDIADNITRIK